MLNTQITEIQTISDLQELVRAGEVDWKQYGEVNAMYQDGLVLFNYSQSAQFAGRWNFFERISRGLILDVVTGEIVARPFDKFFNYGERTNDTAIVDITEKMDGSLGVLYRHKGDHKIATRGSFNSDQAKWATRHLQENYQLSYLSDEYTLLFEIIYPANRVVVNYGDFADLVLIGARNRYTGQEITRGELEYFADAHDLRTPKAYTFNSMDEILTAAKALSANDEGWVIRYADGERLKIKGDAYRLAHKIMTGVTFNRVLEAVRDGLFDKMIEGVPDEFLAQIKAWKFEIDGTVDIVKDNVRSALEYAPQGTQKEFALWVQANYPKTMQSYLFSAKAGRDISPLIYRLAFEKRANSDKPQAQSE